MPSINAYGNIPLFPSSPTISTYMDMYTQIHTQTATGWKWGYCRRVLCVDACSWIESILRSQISEFWGKCPV
jgi:hypothetical protein